MTNSVTRRLDRVTKKIAALKLSRFSNRGDLHKYDTLHTERRKLQRLVNLRRRQAA